MRTIKLIARRVFLLPGTSLVTVCPGQEFLASEVEAKELCALGLAELVPEPKPKPKPKGIEPVVRKVEHERKVVGLKEQK